MRKHFTIVNLRLRLKKFCLTLVAFCASQKRIVVENVLSENSKAATLAISSICFHVENVISNICALFCFQERKYLPFPNKSSQVKAIEPPHFPEGSFNLCNDN